jgi:paraquat-inducible protein B
MVGLNKQYTELPTVPSSLEQLTKTVQSLPIEEIADKLVKSLDGIQQFVNSPELHQILTSLHGTINDAKNILETINGQINPIVSNVNATMKEARDLFANVNKQVTPLAADVRETVREAKTLVKSLDKNFVTVTTGVDGAIKSAQMAVKQAEVVLTSLDGVVGQNSDVRFEFVSAMKEFNNAARSLRVLSDYLERHPEALIKGKGK